ncbi:MAG TPA: hypothetical protein VE338_05070 [Ktedonobacterales bacterium]|nr:hypothetical protein [Ktedonobacterales bacterium]
MHRISRATHRLALAPRHMAMFTALALVLLAGCGFHPGGDQIAYLRGDQLWVVNPDGSNARQLTPSQTAGFAWSPDHHELVFRYAAGAGAGQLPGATWAESEGVSELGVTSISGGTPTQITPTANGLARSDAWWDPQGNRLLYREYTPGTGLIASVYVESQNDQPVGIARKVVLASAALPTLSPDGSQVAVIDPNGAVRLGSAPQIGAVVAQDALVRLGTPGDTLPARLLWQPGHNALVYPSAGENGATTLTLLDLAAHKSHAITSVTSLRDVAFSPDGSLLLLAMPASYMVWPIYGAAPRAVIEESDPLAQAYWSPDGRWLLLEDHTGARLIRTSDWSAQATLTYANPLTEPQTSDTTPWRPAASSPWSADSSAFTFASGKAVWQGQSLTAPQNGASAGLYVEQVSQTTAQGAPTLIASGAITAPGWSCPDPSTTLLQAAA